jgi:DNA-binding MarR family transcriptional regulator
MSTLLTYQARPMTDTQLRQAVESFYFAYRAFTEQPDKILAARGLNRVHHRILYFVGREPGLNVARLLAILQVSKQALNTPLRQLLEMGLVIEGVDESDRRVKPLRLSGAGQKLEQQLTQTQTKQLSLAFKSASSSEDWFAVMQSLGAKKLSDPSSA